MKFGIIAEGRGDCAVILNILIGLGLIDDWRDVSFLRPEFSIDISDLPTENPQAFSSWTLVKADCIAKHLFQNFFNSPNPLLQERKIIIHLDSAECHLPEFGVQRPDKKANNYCETLRQLVIEKITEWLENQYLDDTYFAIAVEEIEAWLLALWLREKKVDTSLEKDAKKSFDKLLNDKRKRDKSMDNNIKVGFQKGAFSLFDFYSLDFQKLEKEKVRACLNNNLSLKLFINSLPLANSPEENS